MSATVDDTWRDLVTGALLGTDRRDPPAVEGPLGDLVADTATDSPSERMLALVAACTSVRRAGLRPLPPAAPTAPPCDDQRPVCPAVAIERWRHVTTSWPVLEDEWTVTLLERGWKMSPTMLPAALRRHRRDAVRHARVVVAAGPLAEWLIDLRPELATTRPRATVDPAALVTLPELPVPPELVERIGRADVDQATADLAGDVESGRLGTAHRAVLINLVARVDPGALPAMVRSLDAVEPMAPGHPLASVLSDLARVRGRMLDELAPAE